MAHPRRSKIRVTFVCKENDMNSRAAIRKPIWATIVASHLFFATSTLAADIKGQVLGGAGP